ncbi:hypothetical protein [Rhodococcus chondri]|uniref:Uncharacterized protein n=1 Tax=Rhodococcus chondri TaxID=3065941 RepID=A0ABU7JRN9_9NOCA|nr:hypothetical protein [Rhodococcus sp. CC-R104]MEE2031977.1 hypothetical protein [Rhodococcus sp. CC-R104]
MTDHFDSTEHLGAQHCGSYGDGHHVHFIRARKAFEDSDLGVGALVRVLDGSTVELSWDGIRLDFRHHDTNEIVRAIDAGGDIGTWVPRWRVLILPGEEPRVPATFTLAAPDTRTECVPGRVPALKFVPGF